MSAFFKRICGKPGPKFLNFQRLIGSLDIKLQVTPCFPAQRHESAVPGAVCEELVKNSLDLLAEDFVTVALLTMVVDQGFGVGEANSGSAATTHSELGICRGQMRVIDQRSEEHTSE